MVPQVCNAEELIRVKSYVKEVQEKIEKERQLKLVFRFGTMIEVVRACVTADELAKEAEFFSFGTNDLTQATFSFSREDAEINSFRCMQKKIFYMITHLKYWILMVWVS
jgi:pyruvate,orthophosphate dikinase